MRVRVVRVVKKNSREQHVENISRLLMQLSWVAQKQFAQSLAQHDLTFPQFLTLAFLVKTNQHCSMNQLAEATHQDAATMTGVVDRLEKLGLVERSRSREDRRVVLVQPTQEGVALISAVKKTRDEMMANLFATFDSHTLAHLSHLLEQLWQVLEAQARATNGACEKE
jgi:MarR family transcriptional regulator, organic hydroperoxide resistance regulator